MTSDRLARINELAKKAKTIGLSDDEKAERETLRNEYRAAIRASLVDDLEHITIVDKPQ